MLWLWHDAAVQQGEGVSPSASQARGTLWTGSDVDRRSARICPYPCETYTDLSQTPGIHVRLRCTRGINSLDISIGFEEAKAIALLNRVKEMSSPIFRENPQPEIFGIRISIGTPGEAGLN